MFCVNYLQLCPFQAEWKGVDSEGGKEHTFSCIFVLDVIRVIGNGQDEIGPFTIDGERTSETKLQFVKQYHGKHSIKYVGELSPDKRSIEGTFSGDGKTGTFSMTKQD